MASPNFGLGYNTNTFAAAVPPSYWATLGQQSNPDGYAMGNWSADQLQYLGLDPTTQSPFTFSSAGTGTGADAYNYTTGFDPSFTAALQSKGLTPYVGQGESGYRSGFVDANGNIVGPTNQWGTGMDDAFGAGMLAFGALAGGAIAAGAGATDTGAMGIGQIGASQMTPQAIEAAAAGQGAGAGSLGYSAAAANGLTLSPEQMQLYQNAFTDAGMNGSMTPQQIEAAMAGSDPSAAAAGGADFTGSDAHFLTNPGDLGNIGGASGGFSTLPGVGSMADSGIGSTLSDALNWAKQNPSLFGSGTSLLNGLLGYSAAQKAAGTQASAANNAAQLQYQLAQQLRSDQAPWRTAGGQAVSSLADRLGVSGNTGASGYGSLLKQFTPADLNSQLAPNYQFMLNQGLGATTNAANAGGFSGNLLKGVNDYAQNYAQNAYQQAFDNWNTQQTNVYNRLSNLAGLGQQATTQGGQLQSSNTQAGGNFATSGAASSAAGTIGGANSLINSLNNAAGWNYLNQYTPSDIRLKTDIHRVGETDSGLPLYTYRYKAGGGVQIGVMAQDVEKVAPELVARGRDGFLRVNYTRLKDI